MFLLKISTIKSWTISCRPVISFQLCLHGSKNDGSSEITSSIFEERFDTLQAKRGNSEFLQNMARRARPDSSKRTLRASWQQVVAPLDVSLVQVIYRVVSG